MVILFFFDLLISAFHLPKGARNEKGFIPPPISPSPRRRRWRTRRFPGHFSRAGAYSFTTANHPAERSPALRHNLHRHAGLRLASPRPPTARRPIRPRLRPTRPPPHSPPGNSRHEQPH